MYEDLMQESLNDNMEILEIPLNGNIKGMYCSNTIALNSNINTSAEKNCVLAEEMGHHYTTHGNIINLKDVRNIKQEKAARNWAYKKLVPLHKFIDIFKMGLKTRYEIAEYLNITEEFLEEAIKCYKEKYGTHFEIDDYIICFEPNLGVLKMF